VERFTWQEVMDRYGSDKPDLRYDLPITDISTLSPRDADSRSLKMRLPPVVTVRALRVPGGAVTHPQRDRHMDAIRTKK
jgi:aspartyl-tRNA synthetase